MRGQYWFWWNAPVSRDNYDTYWCAQTWDGYDAHAQGLAGPRRFRVVNSLPPVTLTGPANGSIRVTDTPTLTASVGADPDGGGDAASYRFVITPTDGVGVQAASEWRSADGTPASWMVPAGTLDPTASYQWGIETKDNRGATSTSPKWTIRVQPYMGASTVAPMQTAGAVAVNLASGNVFFTTASPSVATVAGPVGVSYAYNSQDRTNLGLRGTYFNDANGNWYQDGAEQIYLSRRDAIPSFNWGNGSPSPSVPVDGFSAQWTGYITVPASGSWTFRITHDDNVYLRINGAVLHNEGCCGTDDGTPITLTAGQPYSFELYYKEGTAAAYVQVEAYRDGVSYGLDPVWFTTRAMPLPLGWTLTGISGDELEYAEARVTEAGVVTTRPDGTQDLFAKSPDPVPGAAPGFDPPPGNDDTVTVNAATGGVTILTATGIEEQFDQAGTLTSTRTPTDDRAPAAPSRNYTAAADGSARLRSVADPGRGGATVLTLDYQGGPGTCPTPPAGTSPAPTGMLCQLTYVDGTTSTFGYTTGGQLTTIVDPGGERNDVAYDAQQRITTVRDPLVNDWIASPAFDGSDQTQYTTTVAYTADGKGQVVTQPAPRNGDPRPGATVGDGSGSSTVTVAGLTGTARTVTYDPAGRMTSDTDAVGRSAAVTLDNQDRVVTADAAGRRSTNIYNDRDQLTDTYEPAPISCIDPATNLPNGSCPGAVPHTHTDYDQNLTGLGYTFWNTTTQTGAAAGHATIVDALNTNWPAAPAAGVNPDGFSYQATGSINVPATGDWTFRVTADDAASLYIDDKPVTAAIVGSHPGTVTGLTAGNHRIRITGNDIGGPASLLVEWGLNGGGLTPVPSDALTPNYGLVTRVTTDDSGGDAPSSVVNTRYTDGGWDPYYGLVTATVNDPAGLAHTESYTYEPAGTGLLRRLSRTPARRQHLHLQPLPSRRHRVGMFGHQRQPGRADEDPYLAGSGVDRRRNRLRPSAAPSPPAPAPTRGPAPPTTPAAVSPPWRSQRSEPTRPAPSPPPTTSAATHASQRSPTPPAPSPPSPTCSAAPSPTQTCGARPRPPPTTRPGGPPQEPASPEPSPTATTPSDGCKRCRSTAPKSSPSPTGPTTPPSTRAPPPATATPTAPPAPSPTTTSALLRRVASLTWTQSGGALLTKDVVARSLTGRVLTSTVDTDPAPTYQYTYDTVGRLIRARTAGIAGVHDNIYCYEQTISGLCDSTDVATTVDGYNSGRNSNRATRKDAAAVQARYSYDGADRLTAVTDTTASQPSNPYQGQPISYDTHGNTVALAGETIGYDQTDRHLTTTKGATSITYTRDATDRIIQRTGPDGTLRHTYSGTGDTGDGILDISNNLVEATIVLPGGVLYTKRPITSNNVWSHPNIHGDYTASTNNTGTKQGGTLLYDAYGIPNTILPNNLTGDDDNGWLGQHQRLTNHTTGLQQAIEMGARIYDPTLGRFVEVDPVEGGSDTDYAYPDDPIGNLDLSGKIPTGPCTGIIASTRTGRTYRCPDGTVGTKTPNRAEFIGTTVARGVAERYLGWTHRQVAASKSNSPLARTVRMQGTIVCGFGISPFRGRVGLGFGWTLLYKLPMTASGRRRGGISDCNSIYARLGHL